MVPNQKYGNRCILILITIKVFKKTKETSLVEVAFPIFSGSFGKNLPKLWETNLSNPLLNKKCLER